MRIAYLGMAIVLLQVPALACADHANDWKAFDDPKAVFITDTFAKSLSKLPDQEKAAAIDRLRKSLDAKEVEIRRRAAITLGSLDDKSGVPVMIADLPKATGRDRDNVVVALRVLKDKRAIPALREALKDKSSYVRGIALAALGELKATEAYDEIVKHTKDRGDEDEEKNGKELNCCRISPAYDACYALGALGEERAIPVLIELLNDKDVQTAASQSLKVLTKQDFGSDAEKWKEWWKTHKQSKK